MPLTFLKAVFTSIAVNPHNIYNPVKTKVTKTMNCSINPLVVPTLAGCRAIVHVDRRVALPELPDCYLAPAPANGGRPGLPNLPPLAQQNHTIGAVVPMKTRLQKRFRCCGYTSRQTLMKRWKKNKSDHARHAPSLAITAPDTSGNS
jgi:hypothetical protein